jgi:hypothetical protein
MKMKKMMIMKVKIILNREDKGEEDENNFNGGRKLKFYIFVFDVEFWKER